MAYKNRNDQLAYARFHYQKYKEKYKSRAKIKRNAQRQLIRELIQTHKLANPCIDCGETDPIVLDFDHKNPKTKEFNVGESPSKVVSLKRVINEMAKCEIRCSNCHRKKTHKDRLLLRLTGRTVDSDSTNLGSTPREAAI